MRSEPTTEVKMRRLPWSLAGNAANAAYSQLTFFGSVFVLFLSELGLTKTTIGTLLSLIPFFGLVALFLTPAVARTGYKRVYIACFTARKFFTLALPALPWVLAQHGPRALLWVSAAAIGIFALLRAIAITGSHPWEQEYIPDSVRGRYAALNQVLTALAGFLAIGAAGAYLGSAPPIMRYQVIFCVATGIGLLSMLAWVKVPGGARETPDAAQTASPRGMIQAARDPNLAYFLAGLALVTLASTGMGSFVTLFMREEVGLTTAQVVRLQLAGLVGALVTSFAWGSVADRHGSRPVLLLGVLLKAAVPAFWFALPRSTPWTVPLALAIAAWQGAANVGWTVGSTRLLFTDVVPWHKRAGYTAVHFAWLSLVEGLSQLLTGRLLDLTAGIEGRWMGLPLDRYSILFAAGIALPLLGLIPLRRIRTGGTSLRQLAGMVLHGRPRRPARRSGTG